MLLSSGRHNIICIWNEDSLASVILPPAQRVTYIGKVMNLEVGKAGAPVSQTQNFITRPYLYGLFRAERERESETEKSLVWRGGGRPKQNTTR